MTRLDVVSLKDLFDRKVLIASFAGIFLLEGLLASWTGMPYDMKVWFQTGMWMNQGINIYIPPNHLGYPPLWALWCDASYRIFLFFGSNIEVWRFAIKLPLIFAHIALTFFVGKFAAVRFGLKTGHKVFFFVLTWSFFLFIAALWGQINVLSALLTFLAFFAVTKNRVGTSALLLGIAVTLKIYPLIALPAFFAYVLKKFGGKQAVKFVFFTCLIPVVFTFAIFTAYGWDILYFLRTIFYWTPVFESNPVLILGGCMNIWSFVALFNVNMAELWILRMIWVPVLAVGTLYWLRKPKLGDADLNLSLISLYVLFMITYGWVSEQTFLDPLPFILLQVLAFRPKRTSLYALVALQILIYSFSAVNWGGFIFEPLLTRFSPGLLPLLQYSDPTTSPLNWTIRGSLGLIVSLAMGVFLLLLLEPPFLKCVFARLKNRISKSSKEVQYFNASINN